MTFAIPCLFGLERLVADECKRLELPNVRAENGRVLCDGEAIDIARLNLNLRCGERVLILLGEFHARSFDQLFEGVKALPWEDYIPREGAVPVRCRTVDSQLHSQPDCQRIVKKAICDRLGAKYGLLQLPETGAKYSVRLQLIKDIASLSIDTTGVGLHKRGYRAVGVDAPLRETLAAALVLLTRYRGKDPLCDPFCGSGTIPIEAALIARNRAPGLERSFEAQRWTLAPSRLWLEASDEAMDKEFDGGYEIWGADTDPRAVAIARENIVKAGVEDVVRIEQEDATRFHWGGAYGRVVTNPPYGERLLERSEAEALYRAFGKATAKLPDTWRLAILSSHTEFERAFGRQAVKKRKLYNGMIKCDLFFYGPR